MGRSDDRPRLPTGTVTFLFTDIEGSTRLLQDLGDRYGAMRDEHAAILRRAILDGGGVEVSTEGDSFFAAFASPVGAVRSAVAARLEPVGRLVRHLCHVLQVVAVSYCGRPVGR
jgi:class 3 adenylate cyclase